MKTTNMENMSERENVLWHKAKKRVGFKWNLTCYLIVNAFLVAVWYFGDQGYFWPVWCMLGWGIGVIIQYFKAYHSTGIFSTEKEYEKLKSGHQ